MMCTKLLQSCPTVRKAVDCGPAAAHQVPLSIGFFRQEYWTGLPFPPPGDLPNLGMEPAFLHLLHWQEDSSPLAPTGSDDEHLFIFLLVIYIPSSVKCLVIFCSFSVLFSNYFCCSFSKVLYIFSIQAFCQINDLQVFSPRVQLVFSSK